MVLIVVLLGSVFGLFAGVAGWLFWDASLLGALSIWLLSGPATALAVILPVALIRSDDEVAPAELV